MLSVGRGLAHLVDLTSYYHKVSFSLRRRLCEFLEYAVQTAMICATAMAVFAQQVSKPQLASTHQRPAPKRLAEAKSSSRRVAEDLKFANLARAREVLRASAPPDAVMDWEQQGSTLTLTVTLSREGLHARLVTTCNAMPFRVLTQQLFRWDDFRDTEPVDVTREATRDGPLRVDWRMPDTLTDLERLHRIEAPGLLYGFLPFSTTPYLRDQTLGIKNPQLRMQGQAMQQTLRAISKVNADLAEQGVFSVMEAGSALVQIARPAAGGARNLMGLTEAELARRVDPEVSHLAEEVLESGSATAEIAPEVLARARKSLASAEAKLAKRVDPETSKLLDEAFESGSVVTGERIELIAHATAGRARAARGLGGRLWESAHGIGQSIMRFVRGYDPEAALTRLLPRRVHREMDRFWQREARRLVAKGEISWTAKEAFDATAESIRRTTSLTAKERISHIQRLHDEMFVEWGLQESEKVRLPFSP